MLEVEWFVLLKSIKFCDPSNDWWNGRGNETTWIYKIQKKKKLKKREAKHVHKLTVTLITIAPLFYCWCVMFCKLLLDFLSFFLAFCFLFLVLHDSFIYYIFVTCRRNRIKWFVKIGAFAWYVCEDMSIEYIMRSYSLLINLNIVDNGNVCRFLEASEWSCLHNYCGFDWTVWGHLWFKKRLFFNFMG